MTGLGKLTAPRSVTLRLTGLKHEVVSLAAGVPDDCRLQIAENILRLVRGRHRRGVIARNDRDALVLAVLLVHAVQDGTEAPAQLGGETIAKRLGLAGERP